MLLKRREHREALRKLLPLIETQRNDLKMYESLKELRDYMNMIKQQNDQLDDFKHQIEYQKREIENYKKQLKEMTEEKDRLQEQLICVIQEKDKEIENIIIEQQTQNKQNSWTTKLFGQRSKDQPIKKEEYVQYMKKMEEDQQMKKQMLEPFLNQKNLQMTKNSIVVIDGLGNRLFKTEKGDRKNPPLKKIDSLELRRKEITYFIEFERVNWNDPLSGSDIQKKIHYWLYFNREQFLYYPSKKEKENSRIIFLNKFKLQNIIGTVHFLPIHYRDCTWYICFAIFNYRIVHWANSFTQREAYSYLYNNLKELQAYNKNLKFATEMEVNVEQSDIFTHTSNEDVFVENENVVTWIKNNFNLDQQNITYNGNFYIIVFIYNFFINFYDS